MCVTMRRDLVLVHDRDLRTYILMSILPIICILTPMLQIIKFMY